MQRRIVLGLGALALAPRAFAHHGWSSFDQDRPIWLEGKVMKVAWRNPHAELEIELPADLKLPADLAQRAVPPQSAAVDGPGLLKRAVLPTRRDKRWEIELAPLTRMESWKVPEIKVGESVSVLGFTMVGEKGDAVVRAEYLFAGGKVYGLRSSPA
ncbi:DUF6152 family protein [Rhizobacter sp. Root404]|jgi:hypothetical protein|uniref:DUF6152 family protein n=1 Tax=Rhizobacter sp. Root404 TaxID=1736528 RepID=UPI0006F2AFCD|nr:DUF6152 family protein [Rhizobacter sp. Root404]KQW38348.1 hypothetical protein ASC76_09990 [Rhizobacter sp. Root404]